MARDDNSAAVVTIDQRRPQLWLDVPKGQSFEEWCDTGERLCRTERVLNWWIGDWWAAGHHRYGERAKIAAEGIFGLAFKTLANAASVSRAFEPSRRRELLSFAHHAEVASLPPEDADALLANAEADDMSRSTFRAEAIKRKTVLGLYVPREDDDPEHTQLLEITRRWNRAIPSVRQTFLELAEEANLGVIDA